VRRPPPADETARKSGKFIIKEFSSPTITLQQILTRPTNST